MAQAETLRFGEQALLIGDGATPEVFTAPCGLTSLTRTTNVETTTTNVPDCDDVDLASWLEVDEVSRQMTMSGSGVMAKQSLAMWDEWDREGGPKNVRWYRNLLAADGGGYYQGPAILTTFEESGERGGKWTVNVGLTFDGKPTWTPAA